jgi:tetrahydromethanopterin S-methyltransferase subunit H
MAFTYRWNFDPLEVTYSSASLANVVSTVHWQYYAETEGTSSLGVSGSFIASNIGTETLSSVASADFVAYGDLTEALVTGWVTASMGDARVTEIQTNVSKSLEDQLAPPTGNKTQPW